MDLLGGIRITKRSTTYRGARRQGERDRVLRSVANDMSNILLSMAGAENKTLRFVINFLDRSPLHEMPDHKESLDVPRPLSGYWRAVKAMKEHNQFLEGMLFKNLDCRPLFPYVHYTVFNTAKHGRLLHSPQWEDEVRTGLGGDLLEHQATYDEMFTFIDPSLPLLPKRSSSPNVAYIISVFRSVGNLENLDRTWTVWSGADFIVTHAPKELKLQRLTLHKVVENPDEPSDVISSKDGFSYVLVCELSDALAHVCRAREFVDKIRTRECGYTSLYKVEHYF